MINASDPQPRVQCEGRSVHVSELSVNASDPQLRVQCEGRSVHVSELSVNV